MNHKSSISLDLIADTHGHASELKALLAVLGYERRGGCYRHPERQTIFLGDFIDKGPRVREVLGLVRAMIDGGAALAVMGNHEYNALAYHTPDGAGGFLRQHTPGNERQHRETLQAFAGDEAALREYLGWFERLPLFLELPGLRVVHACWDARAIQALGGSNRYERNLLTSEPGEDLRLRAVQTLLKGPEIEVPGGLTHDEGRTKMRVKWWRNEEALDYRGAALQVPFDLPGTALSEQERRVIGGYAEDAPPVFFGHYGYLKPPEPLAPNVACIDLGVIRGGPLCAYRWDGEQRLRPENFVCVRL